ncbi:tyrosine-protein kinase-like otk [Cylas formicarius]|uniref:tyrosine-protein kinase-like otk n=1 Tax=Cylas formicarius TaxID=197179 RepID=UPI0029584985|nr:tyrosine-protein kinase-like otk [Cylas formicarius]
MVSAFGSVLFGIALFSVRVTFGVPTEDPYFSRSPKDTSVVAGASVTLPCEVTPSDGILYYWELNGSKVVNTTRRHMRGSDLHITRVDRERDVGEFTCIAEDVSRRNVPIVSSPASLLVEFIEDPEVVPIEDAEHPKEIKPGAEVVLRCHLEASGDVRIEWYRNADRLTATSRLEMKKRRLVIKSAETSDNGVYRCTAKNAAGTKRSAKNYAMAVPGDNTALIRDIPADQIVKKGSSAYFHCSYQLADVLEWYFKETGPLKTNDKLTVHSNGTLQINNVRDTDEGWYNCVGIKSESSDIPQSYTAELKLAYLEPFSDKSFEPPLHNDGAVVVGRGSLFQLTCLEPSSLPPAKKWWQNPNGHTISDRGDVHVDDGRLIIEHVKEADAGKYTCVAENIAGKTEKSVAIVVTTKPEILSDPSSVTVDENEMTELICAYNTTWDKYTIVKWRKDGKTLRHDFDENSSNHQRIRVYKHNGTLLIQSAQTSDRGEYVCEIITAGFDPVLSQPATISVIEQLRFVPPPVNKKLELDSVAKIHCKAQGTPPPIVRWEREGKSSENFPSHVSDINGTLHFNKVTSEDKGRYSCIASNSQGTINTTINIDVVVAPRFKVPLKSLVEVTENQAVMIDCVVEGDPEPTIQWDKNLKMNDLDSSRFTVLPNGTLYITEVYREDENKYGCTAGNSAGLNRKEVQLIVRSTDGYHPGSDGDSTVTKAVLITMSVAGAYIILVIGLMVWCRYRRRSRKLPIADTKLENGDMEHGEIKTGGENGTGPGPSKPSTNGIETHKEGQKSDGAETCNSQGSTQSKKSKSNYDKLSLSRSLLKEMTLIGRGEFGDVMVAKISQSSLVTLEKRSSGTSNEEIPESKEDKEVPVLVKVLSQTKEDNCLAEFKREIDTLSKLNHEHITMLLGLCREEEPHYLILEHTDWGDLKKFLVATKGDSPPPLTTGQSVGIVHQLSRGMEHLAHNRMIHKDLAARNCLVTSTLVVKIGMPRLSRDPYSQEYCKHINQVIPLRWLPYEAVYEDEYSTKSDVYSFGVVIWEVFSQGELPHPKINDNTFLTKLKEKKLEWKSHPSTPEPLQKLQDACLDVDPQKRPSFGQLSKDLDEIFKSL